MNQSPLNFLDQASQGHLANIATQTSAAINQPVSVAQVQPAMEQHPLSNQPNLGQVLRVPNVEQTIEGMVPALQKTTKTSDASNFLKKKMEWLSKKTGEDVTLK